MDQNENINIDLFVSGYYEKISPHIKLDEKEEEKVEEQGSGPEHDAAEEPEVNADHTENADHIEESEVEHTHETQAEEPIKSEGKYDAETQKLIDESNEARRLFENSERELRNIEKDIEDIKKKIELDLGPNGEFASMIDQCFEFEDREYVYKLCPFDRTVQKSKNNHGETSIGNWKSWGDGENKYLQMKFENGQACWNGPQRSTNVILSCGIENKLTSVTEPNRCEVFRLSIL